MICIIHLPCLFYHSSPDIQKSNRSWTIHTRHGGIEILWLYALFFSMLKSLPFFSPRVIWWQYRWQPSPSWPWSIAYSYVILGHVIMHQGSKPSLALRVVVCVSAACDRMRVDPYPRPVRALQLCAHCAHARPTLMSKLIKTTEDHEK